MAESVETVGIWGIAAAVSLIFYGKLYGDMLYLEQQIGICKVNYGKLEENMPELASMMNIGKEMEKKLISVGIESSEKLIEVGTDFQKIRKRN